MQSLHPAAANRTNGIMSLSGGKQQLVLWLFVFTAFTMLDSTSGADFNVSDSSLSLTSQPSITFQNSQFGRIYTATTNSLRAFVYSYSYNHSKNSIIRISTWLDDNRTAADILTKYPLHFVIRQQKEIQSWQLPLPIAYKYKFDSVSRFLCSETQEANATLPMAVEAHTFAPENVTFHLQAEVLHNFTVLIGEQYDVYVSPSVSSYYQYTFAEDESKSVTLLVESSETHCAYVSIQEAECPVSDMLNTVGGAGTYQTLLTKASLTIPRPIVSDSVYIVFILSPIEFPCISQPQPSPGDENKVKHISFHIEGSIEDNVYIYAILAGFGYSFLFYLCFLAKLGVYKIRKKESIRQERIQQLRDNIALCAAPTPSYQAIPIGESRENEGDVASTSAALRSSNPAETIDSTGDAEECKKVYRAKIKLMLTDMARKSRKSLDKKYKMYSWNMVTVAIFYILPAAQLVLTYQQVLNLSGNQDLCFYNFLCSRRLGVLHSFNNIFSNLGYVLLGILFMLVTFRRQRKIESLPTEIQENYGIPQYFGLFYAMGWAVITEGVMSACYHVCPSSLNFQFDTSFMYILSGLMMLRLFQSRHPDINANAHVAILSAAAVIGLVLMGVVYKHVAFWAVFCLVYALAVLFLSVQIYYARSFKFLEICAHIAGEIRLLCFERRCSKPEYKVRFMLLIFINLANCGLSLYGAISKPKNFATFVLAIFIMNMMIYSLFYIVMKLIRKERLTWSCVFYLITSVAFAAPAMYFFTNSLTDWQKTPAQSRDLNAPCLLLDFFDGHDIWHFLSAGAILSTFLLVFHIDDDLMYTPRTEIPVF